MNPVIETIKQRRSVRAYTAQPVSKEVIEAIIEAGNWAPTGHNMQRWRFVVVEDKDFRKKLVEATLPVWKKIVGSWHDSTDAVFREYLTGLGSRCLDWTSLSYEETVTRLVEMSDGMYWGAPVVIFVVGTFPAECQMVCQNMLLAAQSFGLGSCIVGFGAQVTGDPEIVAALELQKNEKIFGPIVVGYPEVQPEPPKKEAPVVKWL